jgi:hypothetical protein
MKTKLEDFLNEKEEYVGAHSAPTKDDSPLYDLTNVFGDDIYSSNAARYFTSGDDIVDIESLRVIKAARNRPNYPVKIYRAVPDLNYDINKKISNIRYIINYYDKFRFFPLKNEIVNALQDKYENLKYDDQIKIIIDELHKSLYGLSFKTSDYRSSFDKLANIGTHPFANACIIRFTDVLLSSKGGLAIIVNHDLLNLCSYSSNGSKLSGVVISISFTPGISFWIFLTTSAKYVSFLRLCNDE